jgi:hypothetical protein
MLRAEVDRDAEGRGEQECNGRECGPAGKHVGEPEARQHDRREPCEHERSLQALEIRAGNKGNRKERLRGREHTEAAQEQPSMPRQEDEDGADRAEDRRELSEVSMGHRVRRLGFKRLG